MTQDATGDRHPDMSLPSQFAHTHLTTGSRCPGCHSEDIEARDELRRETMTQTWACRACALAFGRIFPRANRIPPLIAGGSAGSPLTVFDRPLWMSVDDLLQLCEDVLLIAKATCERSRGLREMRLGRRGRLWPVA